VRDADDHMALAAIARDPELADLARSRDRLRLLWEVCQIPDFRKTLTDSHTRLLSQVYRYLATEPCVLPTDWVAEQIARIDRTEGDIDQLVQRIAYIRTWTYISHRGDWLADAKHWQERSRAVEDKLSDALHQQLTQRFVDRRHAMLSKRLAAARDFVSQVSADGDVIVEGHAVGRLEGLRFVPERAANSEAQKSLMTSARRALAQEFPYRLRRLETADDAAFSLNDAGLIAWDGMAIARIEANDRCLDREILAANLDDRQAKRIDVRAEGRGQSVRHGRQPRRFISGDPVDRVEDFHGPNFSLSRIVSRWSKSRGPATDFRDYVPQASCATRRSGTWTSTTGMR